MKRISVLLILLVCLLACQNTESNKDKTLAQIERYNHSYDKVREVSQALKVDSSENKKKNYCELIDKIILDSLSDFYPNENLEKRLSYLIYQGDFYRLVFNTIKKEYIYTDETNWDEIKLLINDSIPVFRGNEDKKRATRILLNYLNVKHSFVANDSNKLFRSGVKVGSDVEAKLLKGDIAYLKLSNHSLDTLYTKKIREELIRLDREAKLSAWIIDLRDCHGGAVGVLALGLAPLYTDSIIGYSLDNRGECLSERIVKNTYFFGKNKLLEINEQEDTIRSKYKPIAVLVGEQTASDGECTALSFKFQEGSRIFGSKTADYTTLMRVFDLASGWSFGIPVAYVCNQEKKPLKGPVVPDVICPSEEALDRAIQWIRTKGES